MKNEHSDYPDITTLSEYDCFVAQVKWVMKTHEVSEEEARKRMSDSLVTFKSIRRKEDWK